MTCVLDLAFGLFLAAQAVAQPVGESDPAASREPVAVVATATVRVIRPAVIDFAQGGAGDRDDEADAERRRQRRVDKSGTTWIEFS
ncbi:MAG: hypothetical protein RIC51_06980 [Erythrobacter sp.]|uniref:hypothetical protein n=1 Tax=Erythrobacter sp. TaxID=1042 RepID=UPI0032EC02EB